MILFFLLPYVSAYTLGIGPTQINFVGDVGERVCKEVRVFSSNYYGVIISENRWAKEGVFSRALIAHTLSADKLNLTVEYEQVFNLSGEKNLGICIRGEKPGAYHGIFLFKTMDGNVAVGGWTNVNITGSIINNNLNDYNSSTSLTGFSIGKIGEYSQFIMLSWITTVLLLVLLVLLFFLFRKNVSREREKDV